MRVQTCTQLAALILGAIACVATSSWPEEPNPDRIDETWIVANLWDGRTAVPPDIQIQLTVGERDFEFISDAHAVLGLITILRADTSEPIRDRDDEDHDRDVPQVHGHDHAVDQDRRGPGAQAFEEASHRCFDRH